MSGLEAGQVPLRGRTLGRSIRLMHGSVQKFGGVEIYNGSVQKFGEVELCNGSVQKFGEVEIYNGKKTKR